MLDMANETLVYFGRASMFDLSQLRGFVAAALPWSAATPLWVDPSLRCV